jgi:hypothetical protein
MMRTVATAAVLGLVAGGLSAPVPGSGAACANATPAQEAFQGTILLIEEDRLTLTSEGGVENFLVPGNANIWLDGVAANLSDLVAGDVAMILAERKGDGLVARIIRACAPQ